jgi:hypothetical protein
MNVVDRALQIQRESGLDVIWIQVGHFFEAYGPIAVELSRKLDLVLSDRNGIPKVGFPKTHTRRWFDRTIAHGYTVGLAYQERGGGYRIERKLGIRSSTISPWDALPDESFLESGDIKFLGIRGNGPLQANEVFKFLSDERGAWKTICRNQKCNHDSKFVHCITNQEEAQKLLGLGANDGVIIYPQAW